MRTTRVLDLCREAEQSVTDCSEHGYAIRKLAQAIRQMAGDEPAERPKYSESVMKICDAVNEASIAENITDETVFQIYKALGYKFTPPPPKST